MGKQNSQIKEFDYKILKIHGYLNEAKSKVLLTVKWGDNNPTFEIRRCREVDGKLQLLKGISIQKSEYKELKKLLKKIDSEYSSDELLFSDDESDHSGKKAVDFDKVFDSASGIMEKREAGFTTKDGFIKLHRRHNGLR